MFRKLAAIVAGVSTLTVAQATGAEGTEHLRVEAVSFPDGVVGEPYQARVKVTGGVAPHTVSLSSPLAVWPTGLVRGTLTQVGDHEIQIFVTDAQGTEAFTEVTVKGLVSERDLGVRWVHRVGDEIVIDGPLAGQRRTISLPSVPGRITEVGNDGRWAIVAGWPIESRSVHFPETLVDLVSGETKGPYLGCTNFSPTGKRVLCLRSATDGTEVVVITPATGVEYQVPLEAAKRAWLNETEMYYSEWVPGPDGTDAGSSMQIRTARMNPPRPPDPAQLNLGLNVFGQTRSVVAMLDRSRAVVFDTDGYHLVTSDGPPRVLASADRRCIVDRIRERLACAGPQVERRDTSDPSKLEFIFPEAGAVEFIDIETGRRSRQVTRRDCVLNPIVFRRDGNLLADCVPETSGAIGRQRVTVSYDSPLFLYYDYLMFHGMTLMIDPVTGTTTEGPKLPFEAALAGTL